MTWASFLIITAAFEQLVEWEKQGLNVPQVSFNVSSSFLETGGAELMKKWRAVVKSPLAMELLENSLLDEDKKEILASVSDLRAAGFSMEIDDFGSGRASILGLLRLRPDKIKLDKALIEPLGNSESQKMTIKSLIEIVRLQGCDVLAEGVETPAQLAVLKELGCDAVQGFFLSQPLTVDACTVELQRAQAAFQAQNWGVVRAV
jgi:EAL domain-containing protein (putative c-di-GMP-specific phosphodiesterase class I)